jgi:serine kinase of HPr protein (carbohydrate metabolism regulator)
MIRLRQATGVAIGDRAVLIEGPPGNGKTSLALALIDRGAVLVGDDGVALSVRDGALWAAPPPAAQGLLEVRNLGLLSFPCREARVALVIALDSEAPRYVEGAGSITIEGVAVPWLAFDPGIPGGAIRAELALQAYGG